MRRDGRYHQLGRVGLRRLAGDEGSPHRLFCFPFLGGQSLSFRAFAAALPPRFEVLAVDPPGHGWAGGAALRRADELLAVYAEALAPWLAERPCFLFGHSMGGLLAHRLAAEIRPRGVLACASPLPHRVHEYRYLRALDSKALFARLDAIGSMGGAELADSQWFFELVMPSLRADLDVLLGLGPRAPRIATPLWVLYSEEDGFVPPVHMHEWHRYAEVARLEVTCGDHQLVASRPEVVADWVRRAVEEG